MVLEVNVCEHIALDARKLRKESAVAVAGPFGEHVVVGRGPHALEERTHRQMLGQHAGKIPAHQGPIEPFRGERRKQLVLLLVEMRQQHLDELRYRRVQLA